MKIVHVIVACGLFMLITGCATVAGDNTRQVAVQSNPSGAAVYVDNQQYGVTPTVVTLPNYIYGGKSIEVRKKGFQPQTQMVNAKFQPIAVANVLFGPGFLIDAITGNLVKVDPCDRDLHYNLHPKMKA